MLRAVHESYRQAFRGLTRRVWLLAFVTLINRMGSMVAPFLVLYLTKERGYAELEAGGFLALNALGGLVGIACGGRLTDTVGARTVMLASLVGTGVALLVLGQMESSLAIAALVTVLGFASESLRPAVSTAIAANAAPEDRTRAFGLLRLAINLGWSIGPAVGGFLALIDYELLFWVDGVSCFAAALTLALTIPSDRPPANRDVGAQAPGASPWKDTTYLKVLALSLLQGIVFFQIHTTFPLHLKQDRGFGEDLVGIMLGVNTAIIVVFEMLLIRKVERLRPMRVMGVAGLLVAGGYGMLLVPGGVAWVVLTVVIWTVGEMLFAPVMTAWVANRADASSRGSYMAAFGMSFSVSGIIAPIAGTGLYQYAGSSSVWYACLAVGAVLYLGYRLIDARLPGGASEQVP